MFGLSAFMLCVLAAGVTFAFVLAMLIVAVITRTCEIIYNLSVIFLEFCQDTYKFLLQKNK